MTVFGDQTVVFIAVTKNSAIGYLGVAGKDESRTPVEGCRFRPVSSTEELPSHVETGMWKCTAPPHPTVLAAKATGLVEVDGIKYLIDGPVMAKPDMDGSVHHVTIYCKRQEV